MRWSWPWKHRVAAVVPRPRQQWRRVPVLRPTIRLAPPLTGAVELGALRPLIHPPLPRRRSAEVTRGTAEGIAVVRREPAAPEALVPLELPPPVRRMVPTVAGAEPVPLVRADPRYLAEPREPEQPHRPPAWLRATLPMLPAAPASTDRSVGVPALTDRSVTAPVPIDRSATAPGPAARPLPPHRPNLGQSRRLGLGAPISRPPVSSERVPPGLAARFAAHGADVSTVTIHRGPEVTAEAAARGTRAFTRDGAVFLPAEAGPLTEPSARGLLGHELTHVVQQRNLGSALPAEDSAPGMALELDAVRGGEWAVGTAVEPPPLRHAPPVRGSGGAVQHELPYDKIEEIARKLAENESRAKDSSAEPSPEDLKRWFAIVRESGGVTGRVGMSDAEIRDMAKKMVEHEIRAEGGGREAGSAEVEAMGEVLKPFLSTEAEESSLLVKEYTSWGDMRRGVVGDLLGTVSGNRLTEDERGTADEYLRRGVHKVGLGRFWPAPEQPPEPPPEPVDTETAEVPEAQPPLVEEYSSWREMAHRTKTSLTQSLLSPYGIDQTPEAATEAAEVEAKRNDGKNESADLNFDQLFSKLYQRVRSALREELLIGRERAGRLSDFR
ncbi:hypothetical protein GCM10010452_39960 [Crossiella cryophila]|uniref:eCIS core domain-containing protein n=1 Tax=Crossiella cryophila TaxID=43355 RepID=UPI0031EEC433